MHCDKRIGQMTKVVMDASAVLALLNQETGYKLVEQHLPESMISTVNLSEVVTILIDIGITRSDAETTVNELIKEIIVFDQQQAFIAAELRKSTKSYGLSLGDRACLALSQIKKLPALTADKAWSKLKVAEVICIR